MKDFYTSIFNAGCLKFGQFKLKSGIVSPVYVDFRLLVSRPELLRQIGCRVADRAAEIGCDRLAAIPYAGIPIGVAACLTGGIPLIYTRKEAKQYGTGNLIEGDFQAGERVLVVDDVITDGASKIEAIEPLKEAGLIVTDVLVLLDREQGGARILEREGYRLHSLGTLSEAMKSLEEQQLIDGETRRRVEEFIAANQFA
ncbi:MAG: orotate phosphoribosyltransferase [Armatimonadota bacterium]|nr:orotate phosphoribosyltransferase [Armatimonadota bacterium]